MRRLAFAALSLLTLAACAAAPETEDSSDPRTAANDEAADGTSARTSDGAESAADESERDVEEIEVDGLSTQNALPITKEDWMARTPGLGKKALNKIVLPGTHDSGTYGLQSVYERPVDDPWAPDDKENAIVRAGQFIGVSQLWSKSQDHDIAAQLAGGIRSLDLRPCREKSGTLRICHGLYGPKMSDILDQVAAFATAHPKEIIVIENAAFSGMADADHATLNALYKTKLGTRILDYGKGEASPTSTLEQLWKDHPGKNVVVVYKNGKRDAAFFPESTVTKSWVNTWDRAKKKTSLQTALDGAPEDTFFSFSGAATPDDGGDLITKSFDPAGTYPKSLRGLADDTNPVVLGWLRDEWSTKPANLVAIDFYEKTCLFELTQRLNGNANASLEGCDIGTSTSWGNWRLGYERLGYGRGAGTPLVCAPGEEMRGALCYPKCAPGYSSPTAFPYLCTTGCPAGYRDDGLTCFRDAKIISANNKSCPWYDKCGIAAKKGCSTCPSGYKNDGCTCRRDAHMVTKGRYERGAGRPASTCGAGEEKDGLLCYPACNAGFHGVGPMCVPNE